MGITPDRFPGPAIEEEMRYEDRGPGGDNDGDPTFEGALRRVTKALRFFVGGTVRQILQVKNPPDGFDEVDLNGVTNGQGLAYNSTSKQFEPQTFAGGSDEKVKVSSDDTTEGYLNGKLVAGDGITLTEGTPGGDETLTAAAEQRWRRHFMMMGG